MVKLKQLLIRLFPYDKLLHLFGGAMIFVFFSELLSWWVSLLIVLLIGIAIEIYDKVSKKGTAEIMDIVYTFGGGALVLILKSITSVIIR